MKIKKKDVENFAVCLRDEEKSAATVEKYCREAVHFVSWLSGRDLSEELVLAYKEKLNQTRTPAGINGAVSALNCLFNFMRVPEHRLKSVRVQRRIFRDEARDLTDGEYRRLLAVAKTRGDERLLHAMEAICSTGIRISELRYFTVEAINLGRVEVSNKGKTRSVLLPGKLQKVLLRYARTRKIGTGPIFITRTGRPLDRSNIWHDMKSLCKEAGVAGSKVFPHNLRHLFARAYYALEKDLARLADILGHSSIDTTRIYTMESGAVHRKRLDRLGLVI